MPEAVRGDSRLVVQAERHERFFALPVHEQEELFRTRDEAFDHLMVPADLLARREQVATEWADGETPQRYDDPSESSEEYERKRRSMV